MPWSTYLLSLFSILIDVFLVFLRILSGHINIIVCLDGLGVRFCHRDPRFLGSYQARVGAHFFRTKNSREKDIWEGLKVVNSSLRFSDSKGTNT